MFVEFRFSNERTELGIPCSYDLLVFVFSSRRQVNEAATIIGDLVDPSANLIFGAVIDPKLGQEVHITLIATGFGSAENPHKEVRQMVEKTEKVDEASAVKGGMGIKVRKGGTARFGMLVILTLV